MKMPGYVANALNRLQLTPKESPKYSPHHQTGFKYFTPVTQQYATAPDEKPTFSKQDTTFVQYIVGLLLYYGRSLEGTIILSLKEISLKQSKPTQQNKMSNINGLSSDISRCIHPITR